MMSLPPSSVLLLSLLLAVTTACSTETAGQPGDSPSSKADSGGCSSGDPLCAEIVFQQGLNGYSGTVDTFLREQQPDTSQGNLGFVEWDGDEGNTSADLETIGLIRFDNIFGAGAGQIPVGVEIIEASLTYTVNNIGSTANLHEVRVSWNETVTFNGFGNPRDNPSLYSGVVANAPGALGAQHVDVTDSLQTWADSPASNRGWIILPQLPHGTNGTELRSSEFGTPAVRPMLTVTYSTACRSAADCDDGVFCNGSETCNRTSGLCQPGAAPCSDLICVETEDVCVQCLTNADCTAWERCDGHTRLCETVASNLPIEAGDAWSFLRGTTEPPAGWNDLEFDDSSWESGPSGFGYNAECAPATVLEDMRNGYSSLYLRKLFRVDDPAALTGLTLSIDYDDSFVAYLNGVEVARNNVDGDPPRYNQLANANHECSGGSPANDAESFVLDSSSDLLETGVNVLAIQGHNLTLGSSDFAVLATLTGCAERCDDSLFCNGLESCVDGSCRPGISPCLPSQICDEATERCLTDTTPVTVEFRDGQAGYGGTSDTYLRGMDRAAAHGDLTLAEWDQNEGSSGEQTIALIRFEGVFGSGSGQVPVDRPILSAELTYTVVNAGDPASVYEALVYWDESFTYNGFCGTGGVECGYDDSLLVTTALASPVGEYSIDVTDSLLAWQRDTGANLGWILIPNGGNGAEFRSSEYHVVSQRPLLSVTYASGCRDDADCDDGLYCNGEEACSAGACRSGTAPCDADECDEADDMCSDPTACPTFLPGEQVGTLRGGRDAEADVNEASGLVASRRNPGVFWTHNDDYNDNRLFAINEEGELLATYTVGSGARDPEDIAIGPGPIPGVDYLYLGDIGDNGSSRSTIFVKRVAEPVVAAHQDHEYVTLTGVETITLRYPTGADAPGHQDSETMMVDPITGDIFLVTKRTNPNLVYRAAYPHSTSSTITLGLVTSIPVSSQSTGGGISPNGRMIVVRLYTGASPDIFIWRRAPGQSVEDAFRTSPCSYNMLNWERQGEAIAWARDSLGFYTVSEDSTAGASIPIWYYDIE